MRLMMVLILFIGGCVNTVDFQMSPQQIGQLDSDEGIVVGSVRISAPGHYSRFDLRASGKHWRGWYAAWSLDPSFGEQVFVTKLPPGTYRFNWREMVDRTIECEYYIRGEALDFTVKPGEVLYIGSWTLRMPPAWEESGTEASYSYSIEVEDRREEVLASAATTHGSLIAKASTELMTPSTQRNLRADVKKFCEGDGC